MGRWVIAAGSVLGFLGVALGAFGRHALEGKVTEKGLNQWQTGSQYQLTHALLLVAIGIWLVNGGPKLLEKAAVCLTIGSVVFAGSLYALALTGTKLWGAVTPIGGAAFLLGWILIAVAALK